MRETIILAPGAKGAELLKSLALHNKNCLNLRICGAGELARIALMRNGVFLKENIISKNEESAIVVQVVQGEKYFDGVAYSDIQAITNVIRRMRSLVTDVDEADAIKKALNKGPFEQKNEALFNVYKKYMDTLKKQGNLDYVGLVKKAIEKCDAIDAEFYTLKEYPLNSMEEQLLEKLSGNSHKTISLSQLFGVEDGKIVIDEYRSCYGAPNEVEVVLQDIYENNKADMCVVALTDIATYSQLFLDYALLYDIPVTFGCGVPIANSNPAKLLVLYYHWITDGFFGAPALMAMINDQSFDRSKLKEQLPETGDDFGWRYFYEVLGGLRLTNSLADNTLKIENFKKVVADEEKLVQPGTKDYKYFLRKKKYIPYLEMMAGELALAPEDFIYKYSRIRKASQTNAEKFLMSLDNSAASVIYEELKLVREADESQNTEDIIQNVLKGNVCNQNATAGALHITDIGGALSCVRQNLYVVGLGASKFPGSPRENYLLLDEDLECFGKKAMEYSSFNRILKKRNDLFHLVRLASGLGTSIDVSYAGLNVSDLKRDNASSVLFELYKEELGAEVTDTELNKRIKHIGYFDPAISVDREIGKAYNRGDDIQGINTGNKSAMQISLSVDREYSPSAIGTFVECPRKYMFQYILGIKEPESVDPFSVISAIDVGNLAHALMERVTNTTMTEDEFLTLAEEYFDRFIMENPPLIMENVLRAKNSFLDTMSGAYGLRPLGQVIAQEQDIHCTHESGVKLFGYPDCVEKLDDGTCRIIDYKSGGQIKHIKDDFESCIQVVIYAYLMESQGYTISSGEFRYLSAGEVVTCKYDEDMKEKLKNRLVAFKNCMENVNSTGASYSYGKSKLFEPIRETTEIDKKCKSCKYESICRNKL